MARRSRTSEEIATDLSWAKPMDPREFVEMGLEIKKPRKGLYLPGGGK